MSLRQLDRRNSGMSIIEVMIAVGITSIVSLVIANLIMSSLRAGKNIDQKSEVTDFGNQLSLMMLDPGTCGQMIDNAIGNVAVPTAAGSVTPITNIKSCNPSTGGSCVDIYNPAATPPANPFRSGVSVGTFTLVTGAPLTTLSDTPPAWGAGYVAGNPPLLPYSRYWATINLQVQKDLASGAAITPGTCTGPVNSSGGCMFRSLTKTLVIQVNPGSGRVDKCYSTESGSGACTDLLGGIYDSTKTPSCALPTMNANPAGVFESDMNGNQKFFGASFAENTTAPGYAGNGNIAVYGTLNPGIAFGALNGGNSPPPVVDSGSASIGLNLGTGQFKIQAPPSAASGAGGTMISSFSGPVQLATAGSPAITVNSTAAGTVNIVRQTSIGPGAPSGNLLTVAGAAAGGGTVGADAYFYTSDRNMKKDIRPLTERGSMLDQLLSLNGVSFKWKDSEKPSIGVIAQDVNQKFPELVNKQIKGHWSVEYGNLVAVIIEAIREIKNMLLGTDAKVIQLQKENAQLTSDFKAMKDYICKKDSAAPMCTPPPPASAPKK